MNWFRILLDGIHSEDTRQSGRFFRVGLFFREQMGSRLELPGTEGCELYNRRNWMLKLGIPEHFVMWPLLVCPMLSLLCAWAGGLY